MVLHAYSFIVRRGISALVPKVHVFTVVTSLVFTMETSFVISWVTSWTAITLIFIVTPSVVVVLGPRERCSSLYAHNPLIRSLLSKRTM